MTSFVEHTDHVTLVYEVAGRYTACSEASPRRSHDKPLANVQGFAEDFCSMSSLVEQEGRLRTGYGTSA